MSIFVVFLIAYAGPFMLYSACLTESNIFETNFRLSLKQMYDGDRLSKKETSILPKTGGCLKTDSAGQSTVCHSDYARFGHYNIPGSIKCAAYPTTILLKQSQLNKATSFSEDQENSASDR
jgi:hypothetical protein